MAQDWTQTTRVLKVVVVVLGLVIVIGLAVLVAEVVRRIGGAESRAPAPAEASLALPAGARVLGIAGGDERVTLLVEHADGTQELLTLDTRSGRVLGRIALGAAAQKPVGLQ